jgi:hypothetical protein
MTLTQRTSENAPLPCILFSVVNCGRCGRNRPLFYELG